VTPAAYAIGSIFSTQLHLYLWSTGFCHIPVVTSLAGCILAASCFALVGRLLVQAVAGLVVALPIIAMISVALGAVALWGWRARKRSEFALVIADCALAGLVVVLAISSTWFAG
jgi:hypothetical protein